MDSSSFVFWIQGALELNPEMLKKGMTPEQVQTIQDHLDLVFTKVTPDRTKAEKRKEKTETPDLKEVSKEDLKIIIPKEFHPFPGSPGGNHAIGYPNDGKNVLIC